MAVIPSIINQILPHLGDTTSKSSHWVFHTRNAHMQGFQMKGIDGFSRRIKNNFMLQFLHTRAQRKTFKDFERIKESNFYTTAQQTCKLQKRILDESVLRHVFTFDLLKQKKLICSGYSKGAVIAEGGVACVIGDGQSNFVSLALKSDIFRKIISVNLPEIHLNDIELICPTIIQSNEMCLVRTAQELEKALDDQSIKLILVLAKDAKLLENQRVDFFCSIASFQEMPLQEIAKYFEIIISCKAKLYSCNRLHKKLYGGEIINQTDYPWKNPKILLDNKCEWHQEFYSLKSLRLWRKMRYDGVIWHRLVDYGETA